MEDRNKNTKNTQQSKEALKLRENLRKRKQQQRSRKQENTEETLKNDSSGK